MGPNLLEGPRRSRSARLGRRLRQLARPWTWSPVALGVLLVTAGLIVAIGLPVWHFSRAVKRLAAVQASLGTSQLMLARRRSFLVYLGATLMALILVSASGFGNWGIAHGQTAPGRQPGARAAEATPGAPGASSPAVTDPLVGLPSTPAISPTTLVGLTLTAAGIALIVAGAARKYRRRTPAGEPTSSGR